MKLIKISNFILLTVLVLTPIVDQSIYISKTTAADTQKNNKNSFKSYTLNRRFSISYPSKWILFKLDRNYIYITSRQPKLASPWPYDFIKTDITISEGSLESKLQEYNRTNPEEKLIKIEKIRINNRQAYRIWSTDNETNTISTLVYLSPKETATVHTFAHPKNSQIVPTIYKIHNSLRVLR